MKELEARKAAVLRAVIEEYIATGQPVSSERVASSRGLGVSSATIRNDMAALEQEGYLSHPHTSAGRIPTDEGYRYFVDHLTKPRRLGAPDLQEVTRFFARAQSALEDLLAETSRLLARITRHASLVVGPQPDLLKVASVQLVLLRPSAVLAVVVLSNGAVEKALLKLEDEVTPATVEAAASALTRASAGKTLAELPTHVRSGNAAVDALAELASRQVSSVVGRRPSEHLYVGGTSNIVAEYEEFGEAERLSRLLQLLEHQYLVVSLISGLIDRRGLTVRIGSENERLELKDCSLVLAPVTIEGQLAGTVGVLGPTRMDYERTMAAVATVSEGLERHLAAS